MHDFNLKRLVYCVWAGLRAHAGSASMARVLGTIPPEPGHCVPGTHHRGMNTLDDPGQVQEAQWGKKKTRRKLKCVITPEEMKF